MPISAIGMLMAGNANSTCSLNTFCGERDEAVGEGEPEWDPDHPSGERDGQAFGGEDPPDVAGVGADAAQHADLAGALEHDHRDRVDQCDHADRDDQQPEHGDRGGDAAVAGAVVRGADVLDLGRHLEPVAGEGVFEPCVRRVDQVVVGEMVWIQYSLTAPGVWSTACIVASGV